MPLRCGQTLLLDLPPGAPKHLHIVLTDPFGNPPKVILVYVSTCRGRRDEDRHLVLSAGDHPFIKHDSYVVFDQAKRTPVDVIEDFISRGSAVFRDDVSPELMSRLQEKMLTSTRVPIGIKQEYRKLLL